MKRPLILCGLPLLVLLAGCSSPVQSVSGTRMAVAGKIKTNSSGLTVEQQNIQDRNQMDNQPGSIKHLYVVSAYSGQVLIYSTVRGKVTSSGKRLTPDRINNESGGFEIKIGGNEFLTNEILGEDGTYGSSIPYIFWWDSKGIYHQHFPEGGQIIHVSDQPIAIKGVIINMEVSVKDSP